MFFIGIFGADRANKPLGTQTNSICPACGSLTRFEIFKTYTYFHIFFIPVFKWNVSYYVRPACCGSVFELDTEIGQKYEKGHNVDIRQENLRPMNQNAPYKTCFNCGARFEPGYSYCPYCGRKL